MDEILPDLRKAKTEGKGKMSGEKMDRELISAEIHKCYCRAYERRFGKPYWTNGDYSKLDEATKDYDREMADWHIKQMETRTPPSGGESDEVKDMIKFAKHTHVNRQDGTDFCRKCGHYLTHPIHLRYGEQS